MDKVRHHIYFESELWRQIELAAEQYGLSARMVRCRHGYAPLHDGADLGRGG